MDWAELTASLSDEIAIDLWQMPVKAGRDCFVAVRQELKVGRFCYQSFVVDVRQWQAVIIDLMAPSDLSSSGHHRLWQCNGAENWHEKEVTWLLRGKVTWFKGVCLSKHFINQNFEMQFLIEYKILSLIRQCIFYTLCHSVNRYFMALKDLHE